MPCLNEISNKPQFQHAVKTSPEKLLSCADWLYPLSSRSGYWFIREDGSETEDTGPDSFIQSIYREAEDSWTLATNYRRVDKGDRVWPYYGIWDGDLGIVGLANLDYSRDIGMRLSVFA